jgi:hypothetical protein
VRVLVGCEYTGAVRDAFIRAGHDAISCDLLPTESPGPHDQGNVLDIIRDDWDLAIFHPPCTYLTLAGVRWLYTDQTRWQDLIDGAVFFRTLLNARVPRIAVENPIPHGWATKIIGRGPTQVIQPWMFGHPERKATALWLKGVSPLEPTRDVEAEMLQLPEAEQHRIHHLPPSEERWKLRSATYPGIAAAMADQWGQDDLLSLIGVA